MKRISSLFFLLLPALAWSQIYVATTGSDTAAGTREKPLASVATAVRKARELRRLKDPSAANGIRIFVGGGTYRFSEPLFIRPEDAGTVASPTSIEALPGTKPVFSGGTAVTGWRKATSAVLNLPKKAQGKVWVADAPTIGGDLLDFRQLWVNGQKAVRARDKNGDTMSRILAWNKKTQQCWIPKSSVDLSNVEGLEFFIHQWWAIAVLRVKSISVKGDSALLSFYQPESRIQSEHPWPAPWISKETGNSAFFLSNALQFLDEPGEWFLDKKARKLYYWPRPGEDMNAVPVVAPVLETLVNVQGTAERPVSHVSFKGISFQHTSWLRPSRQGHVALQDGLYFLDAYSLKIPGTAERAGLENQAWVGRPAAAVSVSYAKDVNFSDCRFEHLASTGLDFFRGTKNVSASGNLFKDVGGNAVLAGVFSDEAMEAHLPYKPADEREVCEDIRITNNFINRAAAEDWGCVGISAGFVRNTTIAHNDLSDLPYTAISLGWGWTPAENVMRNNRVVANKIHRYGGQLYDCAGIYTLSAQPGSLIAENDVDSIYKAPYAHLPVHWFYLYTDEGTSGMTVRNNWTPSTKFLQNANGPGNLWENNGPMVHDSVRRNAGLEPAYRYLLSEKPAFNPAKRINRERPVVIEMMAPVGETLSPQKLKAALVAAQVSPDALYQWNNHYVIFDRLQDVGVTENRLQNALPGVKTKAYFEPFYEFNRRGCSDTTTARQWDHVILTANLVADPAKQQQYLSDHATQFQKWPEVSRGFCNASFQQLLVYKSGRQLMLVISIPKGESLDKLNAKTTENNPRVDEWNRRMSGFQEGIEGTKKGETWMFLKKIDLSQ